MRKRKTSLRVLVLSVMAKRTSVDPKGERVTAAARALLLKPSCVSMTHEMRTMKSGGMPKRKSRRMVADAMMVMGGFSLPR